MTKKTDLEKKIAQLERELQSLPKETDDDLTNSPVVVEPQPIGSQKKETIDQIVKAKKEAEKKAGLVKTIDDGSVDILDEFEPIRIPKEGIHHFENTEECVCECHLRDKKDCVDCYDHPVHLENKRVLIEQRKQELASPESTPEPQATTKSLLKRLLDL